MAALHPNRWGRIQLKPAGKSGITNVPRSHFCQTIASRARIKGMNLQDILKRFEELGDEKVRKHNAKRGGADNQYGVQLGQIRKIAKITKTNHDLALELWETGNVEARFLATLIIKPRALSTEEIDAMVRSISFDRVADWFTNYVLKKYKEKEALRQNWMTDDHPMAARTAWGLTYERLQKSPEGLDPSGLLDRIEAEMGDANPLVQWNMNFCLAEIGIRFPEHRQRAIAIGEKLGLYRDYPTVKGCTSPYAPIWIEEMVSRQG